MKGTFVGELTLGIGYASITKQSGTKTLHNAPVEGAGIMSHHLLGKNRISTDSENGCFFCWYTAGDPSDTVKRQYIEIHRHLGREDN